VATLFVGIPIVSLVWMPHLDKTSSKMKRIEHIAGKTNSNATL
jgi:hypothetical protein